MQRDNGHNVEISVLEYGHTQGFSSSVWATIHFVGDEDGASQYVAKTSYQCFTSNSVCCRTVILP